MRLRIPGIFLLIPLCLALSHAPATACQVPVFRYALERWPAQPIVVVVFHHGTLSREQTQAMHNLEAITPPANVQIQDADLDQSPDDELQDLWKAQADAQLPWVVVQGMGPDQDRHTIWAGPLSSSDFAQLADSPVRQTVRGKLLAGESAAWVLVDGGDKDRDDAAFAEAKSRLKMLEGAIEVPVPVINAGPRDTVLTDLPLKLNFPLIRVSRADPAEKMFLRFLFGGDKGLLESKEPVLVPIFGRGRALVCIIGKDINSDGIDGVATFLAGECSCQVKELSPGYDLLMAADWDSIFREHALPEPAADLPAPAPSPPPEPPVVAAASLPPVSVETFTTSVHAETLSRRKLLWTGAVAAAACVIVFGWLTMRRKRGQEGSP